MFGKLTYPKTRTVDIFDDFFGTKVADPYRWLEDADAPEVLEWTQTQHDFADELLSTLAGRATFKKRLTEVWNYPKYDIPRKRGSRLFFTKNEGLQAQAVLYVQEADNEPRLLLDPNTLSDDGTVALVDWQPTQDGKYLMYSISESGLDWRTFKIRDVNTGEDLEDCLEKIKFSSAAWRKDASGFYYSRFPETAQDEGHGNQQVSHQLYYHKLGTVQSDDELIYEHPELRGITMWSSVSDDDRYLILNISGDSFVFNRMYYKKIDDTDFVRLFDGLDAAYNFVGNDGSVFYIETTKNAPNKQVVAIDLKNPEIENWRDVIPESEDVIQGVAIINQQFVVTYMHHAHHIVKIFNKEGDFLRDVPLPSIGSTGFFAGAYGLPNDKTMFIPFTSFLQPFSILQYDFETNETKPFFEVSAPSFNPDDYETKQVFYQSKDGTTIPMFITAKKDIELNGDNPSILYGYGGYDISLSPSYASWLPVWLENGGVWAVANMRGGGEYGEKWHLDGMLDKKQNTFDDFIAAAEWLIENRYTSTKKLAIRGGSNGGLLVAACMVQRPDLFGAVLCHVPVIDMLRFQHFTAGRYWTSEYGDANSSQDHFDFLFKYSPLHNIKVGQKYPPLLILTADHDDRVVPMHSKKFAAALQEADETNNVILLRIETKAGHGLGKPTVKMIDEQVDIFAFLNSLFEMGVK